MQTNTTAVSILLTLVVMTAGIGPALATTASSPAVSDEPAIAAQTAGQGNCSFPVTRTDATGTAVTVESEPQRIVTLSPSAAQTLWEIGAREKVVGVTQYATYLDGAGTLTNVSGAGRQPNIEQVVGLNPDLVLAPNVVQNSTVRRLRNAGLTVFRFEAAGSIEDVAAKTRLIGRLVGACEGADRIATAMEERVSTIREAVADKPDPNVLYYLGGSFVAGNNTFIGSIIELAGGDNVAASAGIEGFSKISAEVVANRTIEWLVVTSPSAVPNGTPWTSTTAVQQNQTIVVNNSYINEPAPRVVLPLTEIARQLHPAAIQSANLSETPIGPANLSMNATTQPVAADGGNETATTAGTAATATAAPAGGTPGTAGTTAASAGGETTGADGGGTQAGTGTGGSNGTATSSGNGAGFGFVVAAIALLGGALLARRT
jgi:iron complex transport system substrate-binding protein